MDGGPSQPGRVRALPIRMEPAKGEALESWLAALANRLTLTWGELLDRVLSPLPGIGQQPVRGNLTATLQASELAGICAATGIDEQTVLSTTLEGSGLSALRIDTTTRQVHTPWGMVTHQRFCPRCLTETQGRWPLEWRLPWVTVCLKHRCFLSDVCPVCDRPQYIANGWFSTQRIPQPSRCRCRGELAG